MNRIKENLLFYCDNTFRKHWVYKFDNGYGASIIKGMYVYGNKFFPYELRVIKFGKNGYFEPVKVETFANDGKGYLNIEEVKEYLEQIKKL
jgi:hypothetical protein